MVEALFLAVVLIATHGFALYVGAMLAHLDLDRAGDESLPEAWRRDCGRESSDPDKETPPPGWDEANRWYRGAGK